jgi:hypothetical protein
MKPRIKVLVVDESTQAQRIINTLAQLHEVNVVTVRKHYFSCNGEIDKVQGLLKLQKAWGSQTNNQLNK